MHLPMSSSKIPSFSSSNHPGLNFSFASCACTALGQTVYNCKPFMGTCCMYDMLFLPHSKNRVRNSMTAQICRIVRRLLGYDSLYDSLKISFSQLQKQASASSHHPKSRLSNDLLICIHLYLFGEYNAIYPGDAKCLFRPCQVIPSWRW